MVNNSVADLRRENAVLQQLVTSQEENEDVTHRLSQTRSLWANHVHDGKVMHNDDTENNNGNNGSQSARTAGGGRGGRQRLVAGNKPFSFATEQAPPMPTLKGIVVGKDRTKGPRIIRLGSTSERLCDQ